MLPCFLACRTNRPGRFTKRYDLATDLRGWLGGIGFTMSLFIANLAFGDDTLLSMAKVGILIASLLDSFGGLSLLSAAQSEPDGTESLTEIISEVEIS